MKKMWQSFYRFEIFLNKKGNIFEVDLHKYQF